MENQESLQASTLISKATNSVKNKVNNFFTNSVVTSCIVVCSILFTSDQLLGVEKLTVGTSANFINYGWLQVNKNCSWYVFSSSCFTEESVERVVSVADRLLGRHLAVRLDAMLQTVQFPAGISYLHSSLSNVNRYALPHYWLVWLEARVV